MHSWWQTVMNNECGLCRTKAESNLNESVTHTHLTALCPGLPGWGSTRKVKLIWILLKQETVSGSGISWAICKSAPRCRQTTTSAAHHSVFLQAGCPSCHPSNSVKALKGQTTESVNPLDFRFAKIAVCYFFKIQTLPQAYNWYCGEELGRLLL